MIEQIIMHIVVIALGIVFSNGIILIQIKGNDIFE